MIKTFLISAVLSLLPISELRGAIPYAYLNGMSIRASFLTGLFFNSLVAPIGFLFLGTIHKYLDRVALYHRFFEKTVDKARKKVGTKVEKYGLIGLMLFVAVPLPVTGAWTGTIGAWILGLDRKKSTLCIIAGVLVAAIIVTSIVLAGTELNSVFIKKV